MDRTEPTHPEKLRDATRVATIRLDRHRRKRRLHVTGLQQNRLEAASVMAPSSSSPSYQLLQSTARRASALLIAP
jgi:dsDNA-specific endonuclease/ATPase MutS2